VHQPERKFSDAPLPMKKTAIVRECFEFLIANKKWWILPIFITLLLLGALLIFAKGSALAPFIYTLF
jgi:hypothetical protein